MCGLGGVVSNALLLTERDVRAVLPMPDLITAMESALTQFSAGAVRLPVRSVIGTVGLGDAGTITVRAR